VNPDVERAVEILRAGGLVAFPTETVYGLGADASNPDAVRRIFTAKGRPPDHPLIVHLATPSALTDWAAEVGPAARRLADTFWPGPLTLLVRRAPHVLDVVTGGRPTVGLRVPRHPLAQALLEAFGGGIAAPSANRFGKVSPTTASHVRADLGDAVDLVLDGGPCRVGIESTIVDCSVDPPQLLRAGGVTAEQITRALGDQPLAGPSGPSRAPGMLESHYAPLCEVRTVDTRAAAVAAVAAAQAVGQRADVLDPGPDLDLAGRSLYGWLRSADDRGLDLVVAVLPPPGGLGTAIRDRLLKASAPR